MKAVKGAVKGTDQHQLVDSFKFVKGVKDVKVEKRNYARTRVRARMYAPARAHARAHNSPKVLHTLHTLHIRISFNDLREIVPFTEPFTESALPITNSQRRVR